MGAARPRFSRINAREALLVEKKFTSIGGQAVIEGVMMRSPTRVAVAVRRPDGSLAFLERTFESVTRRHKLLGLPVVRGAVSLFEMVTLLGSKRSRRGWRGWLDALFLNAQFGFIGVEGRLADILAFRQLGIALKRDGGQLGGGLQRGQPRRIVLRPQPHQHGAGGNQANLQRLHAGDHGECRWLV